MQTREAAESGVGETTTAVGEEDVADAKDEVRGDEGVSLLICLVHKPLQSVPATSVLGDCRTGCSSHDRSTVRTIHRL